MSVNREEEREEGKREEREKEESESVRERVGMQIVEHNPYYTTMTYHPAQSM